MKRKGIMAISIIGILYLLACTWLYFFQEKLIFHPQALSKTDHFTFEQPYEELCLKTKDNISLNALLFPAPKPSRGLVFYLHGNGGSLQNWGAVAGLYQSLGYDILVMDYRGYGKSEGHISGQQQLFDDVQAAYNLMKTRYEEASIIVIGYSVGTGLAAKLAADNHPKQLILQAPYYSFVDLAHQKVPIIPAFIIRYPLETNKYLQQCRMPVVLFHGDKDEVIPYQSSLRLKSSLKAGDTVIILPGQGHNGMTDNPGYQEALRTVLKQI